MANPNASIWKSFRAIGDVTGYRRQPVTALQYLYVLIFWPMVFAAAAYVMPEFEGAHRVLFILFQRFGFKGADDPKLILATPALLGIAFGGLVALAICGRLWLGERAQQREARDAIRHSPGIERNSEE